MKLHKTILRLSSAPTGINEGKRTCLQIARPSIATKPIFLGFDRLQAPETPIWLWQLIKQHVHTYSDWIEKLKLILDRILCFVCPRNRDLSHNFCQKTFSFVDLFMRHGLELFILTSIYFPLARLVLSWFKVMSHLSFHANLLDGSKQTLSASRAAFERVQTAWNGLKFRCSMFCLFGHGCGDGSINH